MPSYVYPLPTTSLITFSNVFIDPTSKHTTDLADATSARTRLHLALKAIANNEPGSSALAVIEAVQIYLPYLRGIITAVDADRLIYKTDPIFHWRSPLTHYTISTPLLPLHSLHSEHLFVLVAYILALSNYAASILASLPQIQGGHLTTEEEKRTTAGLARAVDLLCQAAGVADWTAENVIIVLDPIRTASGGRIGKHRWPIEASAEALRGLSMTLLADAHITAIRKLLLPVLSHTLFAPAGPPLPSNHPSPSLLAKLYLHVTSCYTSSRALFKVNSDAPKRLFKSDKDEPDSVEGEVIPGFKRYLRKESMLSLALAHKWLGVDVGENGKDSRSKVGEAISWMKDALSRLEELEDSAVREKMKGLGIGKSNEKRKEERMARKSRVERDVEDVGAWLASYKRQNDSVAFQPIPPVSSLTTPPGRPIFAAKPFVPPPSKFADEEGGEVERATSSDETYAGKGNYF